MNKYNIVIAVLILILLILSSFLWLSGRKSEIISINPDGVYSLPSPTTSQLEKRLFTVPTKYKNITIEFKPKSRTYVVYYQGDEMIAKDSTQELLSYKGIVNTTSLKFLFIDLDPISSPDRP